MANYLLGVDGGGTNCRARLCNMAGETLGEGTSGYANIRIGLDVVWANINQAIAQALKAAGLSADILSETCAGLGLAGICDPASAQQAQAAGPRFACARFTSDAHIACLGAFSGGDGAILIAGTGSAAFLIDGEKTHSMSGWGFSSGENGSAASLGRNAVREALEARDGMRAATPLVPELLATIGSTRSNIVNWLTDARPHDFGALSGLVFEAAMQGDRIGIELVGQLAREIDDKIRKLDTLGAQAICLMGGLSRPIRAWLNPWSLTRLAEPRSDAVQGAILLARRAGPYASQ